MPKIRAAKSREGKRDRVRSARRDEGNSESTGASLRVYLARVRARFGIDPSTPSSALAKPWTSPSEGVEDDEAEFADAMADCLSVGLPINAALASWISGALASWDDEDEEQAEIGTFARLTVPARHRIVVR